MTAPAMAIEVFLGAAVPATSGSPRLVDGNNNLANTPQATGAITVAQSPAGTSVTNTSRSTSASQNAFKNGHSLNGWNGVRTPGNP